MKLFQKANLIACINLKPVGFYNPETPYNNPGEFQIKCSY
jgi:hypothetical protein